jgi:hypothetical protein
MVIYLVSHTELRDGERLDMRSDYRSVDEVVRMLDEIARGEWGNVVELSFCKTTLAAANAHLVAGPDFGFVS